MELPPVVGFIDMDCFYVAVERARDPQLKGVPCAVVQYNSNDRGRLDLPADADRQRDGGATGGIIAVSYEARARGVTRQMMGSQARKVCPDIVLIQVPTAFGKADLRIYKAAGDDVVALLSKRADATEKRSVDEVAIDITSESERLLKERDWATDLLPSAQNSTHLADSVLSRKAASVSRDDTRKGHGGQHIDHDAVNLDVGGWQNIHKTGVHDSVMQRLVAGAVVVAELRAEVKAKLSFTCSGGVATNKVLAKLGCGLHKPDQQTLLLPRSVPHLLHGLPLERLPGLGGDFGNHVKSTLAIETAGQLVEKQVEAMAMFPEKGEWLIALASGKDSAADPVKDRQLVKSLSNGKTFFGSCRLRTVAEGEHWLGELACELHQRYREQVEQNQRAPTTIGVHVGVGGGRGKGMQGAAQSSSRQQAIDLGRNGTLAQIVASARACFQRWHSSLGIQQNVDLGVTSLGISLTNMAPLDSGRGSLSCFFSKQQSTAVQFAAPRDAQVIPTPRATPENLTRENADIRIALLAGKPACAGNSIAAPKLRRPARAVEASPYRSAVASPPRKRACIQAFFAKAAAPPAAHKVSNAAQAGAQMVNDSPPHPASDEGLHIGEVDEGTLAELPLSIQNEIRQHLRMAGVSQSAQVLG